MKGFSEYAHIHSARSLNTPLSICVYAKTPAIAETLNTLLSSDRYKACQMSDPTEFLHYVEAHKENIDCLIIQNIESDLNLLNKLYEKGTLLPIVIIEPQPSDNQKLITDQPLPTVADAASYLYHTGEVWLLGTQLEQVTTAIEQAIARFLQIAPTSHIAPNTSPAEPSQEQQKQNFLMLQQRRLADKLQERLGYLGIYYKRNPQDFFRHLSPREKKQLRAQLSEEYREIIINYFIEDYPLNQMIDQFVNHAFFADLSVSQILEIHMELMDDFSQQLKLEGRSEEILLDYRLALIDIIAHLCEMYRRSIPREDIPFDVFTSSE